MTAINSQIPFTERCIAAYRSSGDMDAACREVGVHKLTMFKVLRLNGVMDIADRLKMGSPGGRMGASAEQEFSRLVPAAKSINALCSSNPGFDFDVRGWRVDVKACGPKHVAGRKKLAHVWQARVGRGGGIESQHVDLFCIFLLDKPKALINECSYKVFLMPSELVRGRTFVSKTEGVPCELDAFEMQPDALAAFFEPEAFSQ
nr:hypothetical protein [uncultured Albidiferax sp.]